MIGHEVSQPEFNDSGIVAVARGAVLWSLSAERNLVITAEHCLPSTAMSANFPASRARLSGSDRAARRQGERLGGVSLCGIPSLISPFSDRQKTRHSQTRQRYEVMVERVTPFKIGGAPLAGPVWLYAFDRQLVPGKDDAASNCQRIPNLRGDGRYPAWNERFPHIY